MATATKSGTLILIVTTTLVPIQNHIQVPINHREKPEKFNDIEFKK